MRITEIVKLAVYNIRIKALAYLRVGLAFLFAFVLVFSALTYYNSIRERLNSYLYGFTEQNRLFLLSNLNEAQRESLLSLDNISDVVSRERRHLVWTNTALVLGGTKVIPAPQVSLPIEIVCESSENLISPLIKKALRDRYNQNFIIAGREAVYSGEVVICGFVLEILDLSVADVLEQEAVIMHAADSLRVVGVFNYRAAAMLNEDADTLFIARGTLFTGGHIVQDISLVNFRYTQDTIMQVNALFPNISIGSMLEAGVIASVIMLQNQQTFVSDFLTLVIGVIVFVILLIITSNKHYLFKKNARHLGILKAQGMKGRTLFAVLFFELLFVMSIAKLLAVGMSLLIADVVSRFAGDIVLLNFSFANVVSSFIFVALLSVGFIVVISTVIYVATLRRSPAELLKRNF
ncbi:MAG: ABC transporter permease [Firmicutes bacterium]|nr:ABC transporter permease [Bacillota bacterium]